MGNKLKGTKVQVNQHDQKSRIVLKPKKNYSTDGMEIMKNLLLRYTKMYYQKAFPDFLAFIACLIKDEEQTLKDASAKLTGDHKKINSLKTEFDKIFQAWIDQTTEEKNIGDEDEARGEWLDYLESQEIKAFYSALIHYKEHIEKIYCRQLWGKKLGCTWKWIIEDPGVERLIVKYKYLFQLDEPKYKCRYHYSYFITNQDFYHAILSELDIKNHPAEIFQGSLSGRSH